jgi:pyruvate/2-oxoglutarate dehydrogenase complex dihydrolipoamide dehydrogenase (E3) component
MSSHHDVVVIGAGPAGEAAAELGGSLGYSVALVERDTVGGTVVTSGGAPTKTFREAAVYLSSFEKEKIYGVALSASAEVMYPAIRARARQVSEQLRQAALERIRERGVHLVHGEARLDGKHTVVASAADGTQTRLSGVLLGVHAIGEIASEITGTGQAMIHNGATIEDVIRMAYNTPTYTYGYKLAASDVLAKLHPDVLRAMHLPSRAHRI